MNLNTVQTKILVKLSSEGRPLKFSEIKEIFKGTKFYYNVTISRSLKELILSDLIIKSGEGSRKTLYEINLANKELKEILTKLKALPDDKDVYYTIGVKEERKKPTILGKYQYSMVPSQRRSLEENYVSNHIDITLACKKIKGFKVKQIDNETFSVIARLMNNIAMVRGSQAYENKMDELKTSIVLDAVKKDTTQECNKCEKIRKKSLVDIVSICSECENVTDKYKNALEVMYTRASIEANQVYRQAFDDGFKLIISWDNLKCYACGKKGKVDEDIFYYDFDVKFDDHDTQISTRPFCKSCENKLNKRKMNIII